MTAVEPTPLKVLAVCQVHPFGGPEQALVAGLEPLVADGWHVTLTTPHPASGEAPADLPSWCGWEPLELGGLTHGAGARAVGSWPRARRLAHDHDVVYLNGSVAGRLLPALRGRPTVLHIHDIVRRVARHWAAADIVLVDSVAAGALLDPLDVQVTGSPVTLDPLRSGDGVQLLTPPDYSEQLAEYMRRALNSHRHGLLRRG